MKNRILTSILLASSCALLSSQPAAAQSSGFYIQGDAGGNWTRKADLKEFFGPVAPGSKVKFDPGIRLGVAAGYQVTDWFAAEAQTGVMENRISSITGATQLHDATLSNVPFLINVRLQCPQPWRLTPYIGGGAGFSDSILEADRITIGPTTLHGSQSDAVFAAQAFGGLRYRINDQMGVGLEYRYFFTGDPKWKADSATGTITDKTHFSGAQTHSVSLTFQYKF